jgi:2-polyprenyl-3-methyl-5-hydroxy-6-metoxy-1,4-benzoquinol methylase
VSDAFDPETLDFYEREAAQYLSVRPSGVSRHIDGFLERLPAGGSILELGCGGGADAAHMISAGFDVDPTDGVPAMAAQAEALLGCPVRVMRFEELDALERYDAVIANASLLHVPMISLSGILTRIWRALKPGGWHLASYKTGAPEGYDKHGRYYNQPTAAQAEAAYRAAGVWSSYAVEQSMGEGYFGTPSTWLTIVVRKDMAMRQSAQNP